MSAATRIVAMLGVIAFHSSRPDARWCAAPTALAQHHDLVVTDDHGPGLRGLLREAPCSVWVEGPSHRSVRRILLAIDPFAEAGVMAALALDTRVLAETTHAELFALHVWDAPGETLLARHESTRRAAEYVAAARERAATAMAKALRRADLPPAHTLCERGRTPEAILDVVGRCGIDAVVLGITPRPRLARAVLGCTAARVAELVPCHLLVARTGTLDEPRRASRVSVLRAPLPRAIVLRGGG